MDKFLDLIGRLYESGGPLETGSILNRVIAIIFLLSTFYIFFSARVLKD